MLMFDYPVCLSLKGALRGVLTAIVLFEGLFSTLFLPVLVLETKTVRIEKADCFYFRTTSFI